jgi:hypothetical protein
MTVRPTKASGSHSRSTAATKAVGLASTPAKIVENDAVKVVHDDSTPAATTGKAVKKEARMTVRSAKASGPRLRSQKAAKVVELASLPPKAAANESMKLVNKASTKAATASGAVKKETGRSTKASGPHSRTKTAAKAVELALIPSKAVADEAIKLADEASTEVVASEAAKKETLDAINTYKGVATETFDNTENVIKANSGVFTDVIQIHWEMWNSMQRFIHNAIDIPAQFTSCTSFADLAEKQREVMRLGFSEWLNISQEILMANRRIRDRAINALELR